MAKKELNQLDKAELAIKKAERTRVLIEMLWDTLGIKEIKSPSEFWKAIIESYKEGEEATKLLASIIHKKNENTDECVS